MIVNCRDLKILHDNARPHKSLAVRQKIQDMGMHEVPHPPYSLNRLLFGFVVKKVAQSV